MARLLVIEDEAPLLQTILSTLQFAGFEVVGALDGAAGVELAKTYHPDLVISDIRMPEMDGYGVLQALRADPMTEAVPLIFLTAKTEREEMRYGMNLGADDYIPKPFTLSELVAAVETRLAKQARYTDLQQQFTEVSKSEQLKSDMLTIAAHDLRNPITTIRTALNVLMHKFGEEFANNELSSIKSAALHVESIATHILSSERTQKSAEAEQALNLKELVTLCYQDLCEQAHAKSITFECQVPPAAIMVQGDPLQLREAVHHLLHNAIQYTPAGGTVTLRLHRAGRKALLLVQDTGRGMPASQIDQLFQPLPGGLHLVKNVIERHQGRVFVESVPGQGSVFGFFLPVYRPAPKPDDRRKSIFRLIGRIKNL